MVQYHTYSKGVDLASPGILDTSDDAVLHMVRDLSQVSVLSVYFYDELGEVVALFSFSSTDHWKEEQEQELAIKILALEDDKEAATNAAGDSGGRNGGSLLLVAFLAFSIVVFASCVLLLDAWLLIVWVRRLNDEVRQSQSKGPWDRSRLYYCQVVSC